jgi:hypothetical protein
LSKKLATFYEEKFITTFTIAHHLFLFWNRLIQTMPHMTFWKSILILLSLLCLDLQRCLFPSSIPIRTVYTYLLSPYVAHASPIAFFLILSPEWYLVRSTEQKAPHFIAFSVLLSPCPLKLKSFPHHATLKHFQSMFLFHCERPSLTLAETTIKSIFLYILICIFLYC